VELTGNLLECVCRPEALLAAGGSAAAAPGMAVSPYSGKGGILYGGGG